MLDKRKNKQPLPKTCPYYRSETTHTICCQGLAADAECIMRFPSETSKTQNADLYCKKNFFFCPNAAMLNSVWRKYEIKKCRFNDGVECTEWDSCSCCGWNPIVDEARKSRLFNCENNHV